MAARFESTHLPHLLDEDCDVPPRVRRLAAHFGDLVRFASQADPEQVLQTPLACRRRPDRRVCGGLLLVERQESQDLVA